MGFALLALTLGAAPFHAQAEGRDPAHPTPVAARQAVTGLSPAAELGLHAGIEEAGGLDVRGIQSRAVGVAATEQGLLGLGPDYKVELEPGGFRFVPALGREAPENQVLAFRLDSIERGGLRSFESGVEAAPTAEGARSCWSLGTGALMRLDMLPAGAELSFVFAEPPAGEGDLVVCGRVASSMRARATGDVSAGLRFDAWDLGGVTVGRVTGVDAAGETAAGRMFFDGAFLELSLPGAFVEGATYPLTLDPMIGVEFDVATLDDDDPDVAYDVDSDTFLVVWERYFSNQDWDIRGQNVTSAGALTGPVLSIESGAGVQGFNPTVAGTNLGNAFLVVWQQGNSPFGPWDLKARRVDAGGSSSSAVVDIATAVANEQDPDAGGDATVTDDDVLVVWEQEGGGIRGAQVTTQAGGTPFIVSTFTLSTDARDSLPAISKSGGAAGVYLVVWQRLFSGGPGDHDVYFAIVDRNGAILKSSTSMAGTVGPNEERADVDGNGSRWIVAYDTEATLGDGDHDIACRSVQWDGVTATVGLEAIVEGDANDDERQPSVAYVGAGKHFIGYSDEWTTLGYDAYVLGVDPSCQVCEIEQSVALGGYIAHVEMASQLSGDPNAGDDVLMTWGNSDRTPPFDADVEAQLLSAVGAGGPVVNLGGGCGAAGTLSVLGPAAIGSKDFRLQVSGADPISVVGIVSLFFGSFPPFHCGTCMIEVNPNQVNFVLTMSGGGVTLPLPLPCDMTIVGAKFRTQVAVFPTVVTPCVFLDNFSFTDRVDITIGT